MYKILSFEHAFHINIKNIQEIFSSLFPYQVLESHVYLTLLAHLIPD